MSKKIALAADHAGFEEKEKLKSMLTELGVEFEDMGTTSGDSVDYPDFALKAARAVANGEFDQGLLVCGSGTGMAIAANKVHGVRAAVAGRLMAARERILSRALGPSARPAAATRGCTVGAGRTDL